jgi:hypothetical protein
MKEVMDFIPLFFSGSSADPECVVSSNSVVYSESVIGSRSVMTRVLAAQCSEGTECLLLDH